MDELHCSKSYCNPCDSGDKSSRTNLIKEELINIVLIRPLITVYHNHHHDSSTDINCPSSYFYDFLIISFNNASLVIFNVFNNLNSETLDYPKVSSLL